MSSASTSLQVAQVLADLSTLQNTVRPSSISLCLTLPLTHFQDPHAAHALLRANKTLSASCSLSRKARVSTPPDGFEFDYLGRRIKASKTPTFSRQGSSIGRSGNGSGTLPETVSSGASVEVRFTLREYWI